jgi:hypothetical protein
VLGCKRNPLFFVLGCKRYTRSSFCLGVRDIPALLCAWV